MIAQDGKLTEGVLELFETIQPGNHLGVFNQQQGISGEDIVFSGGTGLRFLLFPKRDIYTRLDVAFTKVGTGFYIFIGEAF